MRSIDNTQHPEDTTPHCRTCYCHTYYCLNDNDNEPITPPPSSENTRPHCVTCCCCNVRSQTDMEVIRSLNLNQTTTGWIPHCETCICNVIYQSDTENSDTGSSDLDSDNDSEDPSDNVALLQVNRPQNLSPINKEAQN